MSTTNTSNNDDYKRGFRDGMSYMQEMDDEAAILEVIFGGKSRDELSPRQLKKVDGFVGFDIVSPVNFQQRPRP